MPETFNRTARPRNPLTIWFVAAMISLLANGVFFAWNLASLIGFSREMADVRVVLFALSDLRASVTDGETGQRGFILSGRDSYLSDYQAGADSWRGALARLDDLVAGNPAIRSRVAPLRASIEAKFAELAETIRLYRAGRVEDSVALVRTDVGRDEMQKIRLSIRQLQDLGEDQLVALDRRSAIARNRSAVTLVVATLAALGTLLGTYVLYRRDLGRRDRESDLLREREERYRFLADSMPQAVFTASPAGRVDYFNQPWVVATGRPIAESTGDGWVGSIHPDDRDSVARAWGASIDAGTPIEVEARLLAGPGDAYRWNLLRAGPRRDPAGAIVQWVGSLTDIDDQKSALEHLRASQDRFQKLAEATPMLVWSTRPDGFCEYLSRQWLDLTGVPLEDQIGHGWLELIHPDDRAATAEAWRKAVAFEAPYDIDYRIRSREGAYRWFRARGVPVRDANGQVTQWIGANADVDDQRRAADQLQSMNEDLERRVTDRTEALTLANDDLRRSTENLERSNRELQEFASVASHDLQEPLRKIQAFGDRLRGKCNDALGDQGRDYLERMQSSASRMSTLINDLLAFSRVTSKAQPFVPVDLDRVAREVSSDLEARIAQTEGRVDLGALPKIDADPLQMRQLIQNLLGNALKFRRPEAAPVVRLHAEILPAESPEVGPLCLLTCSDNGIGFDEKYLDRIFNVFQRLHGRNEYEGTGMGLAICRKIVERHGGRITARSAPGEGTTFLVHLPVSHDPPEERTP